MHIASTKIMITMISADIVVSIKLKQVLWYIILIMFIRNMKKNLKYVLICIIKNRSANILILNFTLLAIKSWWTI
jgi:hypothetical protein